MKKYDSYTDSGVDWIGKIPSHWNHSNLKWYSKIYSGGTPSKDVEEYWINGTIPWLNSGSVNQGDIVEASEYITEEAYSNSSAKWISEGSLILALAGQGKTKGMVAQVKFKTTCNQSLGVIVPNDKINNRFLLYWIRSNYQNIRNLGGGDKRDGLNLVMLGAIPIPIPTLLEQAKISIFLDQKIAQIDHLITKKEALIQLLEEERIALINQAVTKGLDPSVPMKDSGIEWLGEIPEHWEVKKLKYLLTERKDSLKTGPFGSHIKSIDYIPNSDFKVYTQRNVLDNEFENGCESISEEKFNELSGFIILEGDILITTRGSIGRCSVFPQNMPLGVLHPCLIRIQVNKSLSLINWVVNYINNTSLFYNNVKFNSNSTIIDVIYGYTLKEIYFPIPPISEQNTILEYLKEKTNEFDQMAFKSHQEIELLIEFKTSLIRETVTGKVNLRVE